MKDKYPELMREEDLPYDISEEEKRNWIEGCHVIDDVRVGPKIGTVWPRCPFCGEEGMLHSYSSFGTELYCADGCHGNFTFPAFANEVRTMWERDGHKNIKKKLLGFTDDWNVNRPLDCEEVMETMKKYFDIKVKRKKVKHRCLASTISDGFWITSCPYESKYMVVGPEDDKGNYFVTCYCENHKSCMEEDMEETPGSKLELLDK